MFWHEDDDHTRRPVSDDVVDLAFRVACRCLPVDHAYALSRAVDDALPWFAHEALTGLHLIHGAESGNGWTRPGQVLYLSRRTRFILRVPRQRIDDARSLTGATLNVAGNPMQVGPSTTKPLNPLTTLYARHVACESAEGEDQFSGRAAASLARMGVEVRKLLCGREHTMGMPSGDLRARSMLLADLDRDESIQLQQLGLGPGRKMGCGIFIPHKSIAAVAGSAEQLG